LETEIEGLALDSEGLRSALSIERTVRRLRKRKL